MVNDNDVSNVETEQRREDLSRGHGLESAGEEIQDPLAEAQAELARQRELALKREQSRKQKEAEKALAWKQFMQKERREIQLRREGQLAVLLDDALPGELPETLQRLADQDRTQAEQGLVALMSGGKTFYKDIDELSPEDMPARIAANSVRTNWLKERRDTWLGRGVTRP